VLSVYISVFTIFIIYLLFESFLLQRRLRSIPIRILVNGTRGKSTIVLLIYQLLRKKGYQVFAKTTGDAPVIYNHDGSKTQLKRIGPARILENVRLLNKWSKKKPHAVVLECMALQPEMQQYSFHYPPTRRHCSVAAGSSPWVPPVIKITAPGLPESNINAGV